MKKQTTFMISAALLTGGILLSLLASPGTVGATNLDASVFHFEYYETITKNDTIIRYGTDTPNQGHEDQSILFEETLSALSGADCTAANNNHCIFGSDSASTYTYTHFLINPYLSSGNSVQIVPLTDDSLIEFSLKLKLKNAGTGELFYVTALPTTTLATGMTLSALSGHEIEFNLFSGDSSELFTLASLNSILTSTPNSIQIQIFGSGAIDGSSDNFKLVRSQLELEYTAPVPEPASLLLLGSGLLAVGAWGWRRRNHS